MVIKKYKMKLRFLFIAFIFSLSCTAQELYSATEPASNIASGAIGFRLNNSIMDERYSSKINYHFIPEVMIGISRKLMVSENVFFSNRNKVFRAEGGSLYMKYRFLSDDAYKSISEWLFLEE